MTGAGSHRRARAARVLAVVAVFAAAVALTASVAISAAGAFARAPIAHAASTCADYPTQAAAQQAADTRDSDHDGIYCEDNPCPCSAAWHAQHDRGGGTPTHHRASPPRHIRLGRSVNLGPVRRHSGCRARGSLPDRSCTPGARFSQATKRKVCRRGYAGAVRNVSEATKQAIYAAYGMAHHYNGRNGEVDHLVSLELGGSNSRANLFPEAARPLPGSHQKDRLENKLHAEVCSGRISLRHAQLLIAHNWVAAYRARFG